MACMPTPKPSQPGRACACTPASWPSATPRPANPCVSNARRLSKSTALLNCAPAYQEYTMRADLNQGLIDFLQSSPTPFHATQSLAQHLEAGGYRQLDERDSWPVGVPGKYYVTRNGSSLIAVHIGRQHRLEDGL